MAEASQADSYEVTSITSPEYTVNKVPSLVVLVSVEPATEVVIALGTVSQLVEEKEMTVEENVLTMFWALAKAVANVNKAIRDNVGFIFWLCYYLLDSFSK